MSVSKGKSTSMSSTYSLCLKMIWNDRRWWWQCCDHVVLSTYCFVFLWPCRARAHMTVSACSLVFASSWHVKRDGFSSCLRRHVFCFLFLWTEIFVWILLGTREGNVAESILVFVVFEKRYFWGHVEIPQWRRINVGQVGFPFMCAFAMHNLMFLKSVSVNCSNSPFASSQEVKGWFFGVIFQNFLWIYIILHCWVEGGYCSSFQLRIFLDERREHWALVWLPLLTQKKLFRESNRWPQRNSHLGGNGPVKWMAMKFHSSDGSGVGCRSSRDVLPGHEVWHIMHNFITFSTNLLIFRNQTLSHMYCLVFTIPWYSCWATAIVFLYSSIVLLYDCSGDGVDVVFVLIHCKWIIRPWIRQSHFPSN